MGRNAVMRPVQGRRLSAKTTNQTRAAVIKLALQGLETSTMDGEKATIVKRVHSERLLMAVLSLLREEDNDRTFIDLSPVRVSHDDMAARMRALIDSGPAAGSGE